MSSNKSRLKDLIVEKALKRGEFILTSGEKSSYYIDGKQITLDAEGAYLVGEVILDLIEDVEVDGVGGLTLGADPIATTVAIASYRRARPVPAFIVRKGAKAHGTMKRIEGPLAPGSRVVIVEDVVTKGGSSLEAARAVEEEGHTVVKIISLVDRLQGGRQRIEAAGYSFESVFTVTDLGIEG